MAKKEEPHTLKSGEAMTLTEIEYIKSIEITNASGIINIYINGELKIVQGYEREDKNHQTIGGREL